jgi:hypothetical protein
MVWTALRLLLVAYVPGALLFRLPVADRARRAAQPVEERLFWAVVISAACSSVAAFGLAAVGRFSLNRLLICDAAVCLLALVVGRRRLLFGGTASRPGWTVIIPLALILGGIAQFFPPSEYVIGGKDPGVYVNEGIAIAQRGSLLIHDAAIAAIPPADRSLFIPPYPDQAYYSVRFMGFFVVNPSTGTVIGQFPHLYPIWIAIGYGLGGLTGALQVIGWWSILGLLAVYFAGARLVGRPAAAAAALLLCVSLLQIWYGRYPNSEMLEQPLVFAALLAFARTHLDHDRFFGWIAGLLLALMLFLRIDAALAVVSVGAASVLLLVRRRPPHWSFLVSLGLGLAAAWVYLTQLMKPYTARPLAFVANLQPTSLALLGLAAVCVAAVCVAARHRRASELVSAWTPRALAVVITAAAVYAYFFRQAGGRLAAPDAAAFRTFAWYLPPEALAVAVFGLALVVWRRFWRDPALLITVAVFSFFFFYKTQVTREHFWAARRFVAVIFPAALLMMTAVPFFSFWPDDRQDQKATAGRASLAGWILRVGLPVVFVGFVGWRLVSASLPIRSHVEYAGVIPRLEAMARTFTADDLMLVEPRYSSDVHVLAVPLAYIYRRQVLVLATPRPDKARFRDFLEAAARKYRHVYLLGCGGADLLSRTISAQPVFSDRFEIPEYESRSNAYPTAVRAKKFDCTIYRLVAGEPTGPFRSLDVGAEDDPYVLRFHAKQVMDGTSYRWSRELSYISFPAFPASARTVTLWMGDGGRPAELPKAHLMAYFEDQFVGEATVDGPFRPYSFTIPPELASRAAAKDDPAVLKLTCNTWNPSTALGVSDTRDLGVMVDRVEVQ